MGKYRIKEVSSKYMIRMLYSVTLWKAKYAYVSCCSDTEYGNKNPGNYRQTILYLRLDSDYVIEYYHDPILNYSYAFLWKYHPDVL